MKQRIFAATKCALTQVPIYETHSAGKNWLAKVSGRQGAPGGLDREFCRRSKGETYYMIDELVPGDVIEFGADHKPENPRPGTKPKIQRWYGVVLQVNDESLVVAHTNYTSSSQEAFALAVEVASKQSRDDPRDERLDRVMAFARDVASLVGSEKDLPAIARLALQHFP